MRVSTRLTCSATCIRWSRYEASNGRRGLRPITTKPLGWTRPSLSDATNADVAGSGQGGPGSAPRAIDTPRSIGARSAETASFERQAESAAVRCSSPRAHRPPEDRRARRPVAHVDQREGDVLRRPVEQIARRGEHVRRRDRGRGALGQGAQGLVPPLGDDAPGGLGADDEGPAHGPVVAEDGRVAVRPVRLLDALVAPDRDIPVFIPGRPGVTHHVVDLRTDDRPDLRPAVPAPLPHRGGMLAFSEAGHVGVVVDLDEFRSPPEEHGMAGPEHDAHDRLESRGPRVERAERRLRPIETAHEGAGLAPAFEPQPRRRAAWVARRCGQLHPLNVGAARADDQRRRTGTATTTHARAKRERTERGLERDAPR